MSSSDSSLLKAITTYPEQRSAFPMNRLFYDHGEDTILEAIKTSLEQADDWVRVNTLHFLLDSFLEYRKDSWKALLNEALKAKLSERMAADNHFVRVAIVKIMHALAGFNEAALEANYQWLQEQFPIYFDKGEDPLLVHTLFTELNTKYGGTWVYDYQITMLTQLLNHPSPAMKAVGVACVADMHADEDELPEDIWKQVDQLKETFKGDFQELRMAFERKLLDGGRYDYRLKELEDFLK